jgi:hypothetical protein
MERNNVSKHCLLLRDKTLFPGDIKYRVMRIENLSTGDNDVCISQTNDEL